MSTTAVTPYKLEKMQTAMYMARDLNGNRLGIISGRAGNWHAEKTNGSKLSCYNTRHDAAMALIHCR